MTYFTFGRDEPERIDRDLVLFTHLVGGNCAVDFYTYNAKRMEKGQSYFPGDLELAVGSVGAARAKSATRKN